MIAEYNEGSCLNKILIDSEIYGENTLKQILGGKDMEMSVSAHTPFIWLFLESLSSPGSKQTYRNLSRWEIKFQLSY